MVRNASTFNNNHWPSSGGAEAGVGLTDGANNTIEADNIAEYADNAEMLADTSGQRDYAWFEEPAGVINNFIWDRETNTWKAAEEPPTYYAGEWSPTLNMFPTTDQLGNPVRPGARFSVIAPVTQQIDGIDFNVDDYLEALVYNPSGTTYLNNWTRTRSNGLALAASPDYRPDGPGYLEESVHEPRHIAELHDAVLKLDGEEAWIRKTNIYQGGTAPFPTPLAGKSTVFSIKADGADVTTPLGVVPAGSIQVFTSTNGAAYQATPPLFIDDDTLSETGDVGAYQRNIVEYRKSFIPDGAQPLEFLQRNPAGDGYRWQLVTISSSNTVSGLGAPIAGNVASDAVTQGGYYYQQLDAPLGTNDIWGPSVAGTPATWPAQADGRSADPLTGALTDFGDLVEGAKPKAWSADVLEAWLEENTGHHKEANAFVGADATQTLLADAKSDHQIAAYQLGDGVNLTVNIETVPGPAEGYQGRVYVESPFGESTFTFGTGWHKSDKPETPEPITLAENETAIIEYHVYQNNQFAKTVRLGASQGRIPLPADGSTLAPKTWYYGRQGSYTLPNGVDGDYITIENPSNLKGEATRPLITGTFAFSADGTIFTGALSVSPNARWNLYWDETLNAGAGAWRIHSNRSLVIPLDITDTGLLLSRNNEYSVYNASNIPLVLRVPQSPSGTIGIRYDRLSTGPIRIEMEDTAQPDNVSLDGSVNDGYDIGTEYVGKKIEVEANVTTGHWIIYGLDDTATLVTQDNDRIVVRGTGASNNQTSFDFANFTVPESGVYEWDLYISGYAVSTTWRKQLQIRTAASGGGTAVLANTLVYQRTGGNVRSFAPFFGDVTLQAGQTYTGRIVHLNEFLDVNDPIKLILRRKQKVVIFDQSFQITNPDETDTSKVLRPNGNRTATFQPESTAASGAKEFDDVFKLGAADSHFIPDETGTYQITETIIDFTNHELFTIVTLQPGGSTIYTSNGNRLKSQSGVNLSNTATINLTANTVYRINPQGGGGTNSGAHRVRITKI